jgi:hypothetical protein
MRVPLAPAPHAALFGVLLCLPMAPALPIGGNGDFGASPSYGSSRTSHCLPVNLQVGCPGQMTMRRRLK